MIAPLLAALEVVAIGKGLSKQQAYDAVASVMTGEASDALIASFLTGLRVRGETADELAGAVSAVRDHSIGWPGLVDPIPTLDTCGTGGDGACTVNISTAAAIVVASCRVAVAKHGNRSASGNSGSAEVLAELGVAVEADSLTLVRCLRELNITFLYAPKFHPALRFAAPIRRQLPFRTLFNMVGPLANPARPAYQLIGVPDPRLADLMAEAICKLGISRAAVVTGSDGLDEVSLGGETRVRWVEHGEVETRVWPQGAFGLASVRPDELRVSGPTQSAGSIRDLLAGKPGPVRDTVLANAAAGLLVVGAVSRLEEGVARAAHAIDEGSAATLLALWATMSQGVSQSSS